MLFTVGSAIQMKVQHLTLRNGIYQFYLRVPRELVGAYGANFIRFSLKTPNPKKAAQLAEGHAIRYKSEFKVLRDGNPLTPEAIQIAAKILAEKYEMNLDDFIYFEVEPAQEKYANGDEETYENADPSEYLTPTQSAAWKLIVDKKINPKQNPNRLSDILRIYLKTHKNGSNDRFIKKVSKDWSKLINLIGDIEFEKLSRANTRQVVEHLSNNGLKTSSIRRTLNTLRAITRTGINELELSKPDPFKSISIQDEGKDREPGKVVSAQTVKEIANTFLKDKKSQVAIMIILQMELGTRIGEISGLGIDDIFLDAEIPYIYFRNKPWRTLKNKESERKVPIIGIAFEALQAAIKLPRKNKGLFESYAKLRGNDSASAVINKHLKKWQITSHDFRHTMKDRLRSVNCPKDIRDAIQGHGKSDIAEIYGEGHSLKTMQIWLNKVKCEV
jgi:integrase